MDEVLVEEFRANCRERKDGEEKLHARNVQAAVVSGLGRKSTSANELLLQPVDAGKSSWLKRRSLPRLSRLSACGLAWEGDRP